jgi:hypothetical protein
MQITIRLGDAMNVTVRSDDQRELIEAAAFFQELPKVCPVCKAQVVFTARHPQSFNYYGLRCTGRPSHESTFGVKKEGGSLFYKASEPWTAWQPGARPESEAEPETEERAAASRPDPRGASRPRAVPSSGPRSARI